MLNVLVNTVNHIIAQNLSVFSGKNFEIIVQLDIFKRNIILDKLQINYKEVLQRQLMNSDE